jgi:hypothetical protein
MSIMASALYVKSPPDMYMWEATGKAKYEGIGRPFQGNTWSGFPISCNLDKSALFFNYLLLGQLLRHCNAMTDLLAALFRKELIGAYLYAKAMLTTRDINSWYESTLCIIQRNRE